MATEMKHKNLICYRWQKINQKSGILKIYKMSAEKDKHIMGLKCKEFKSNWEGFLRKVGLDPLVYLQISRLENSKIVFSNFLPQFTPKIKKKLTHFYLNYLKELIPT